MTTSDPLAAASDLLAPVHPGESLADEPQARGGRRGAKKRDVCFVSGQVLSRKELVAVDTLRPTLIEALRADYPDMPEDAKISRRALNRLRGKYVEQLLRNERGEISSLEREVIESLERHETLAEIPLD